MTGTGLSLLQQTSDPIVFIGKLGTSFAQSGMFGCKTEMQGHVLAMHCLMENVSPLTIMQTYHFIEGKLSMRADAMLGRATAAGFHHKVISRTPDLACVYLGDSEGDGQEFSLSWADAQKEPFVRDKNGNIKTNYATPRTRMQMLWARVVSDAVRTMAPQVVCGAYTPEELDDESPLPAGVIDGEVVATATAPAPTAQSPTAEPAKRTRKPKEAAETSAAAAAVTENPAPAPTTAAAVTESQTVPAVETAPVPAETAATPAATAPALPKDVTDICELRDYVGPRWPATKGPWAATWAKVLDTLRVPAGESDQERFAKADQTTRERALTWLNQQRVNVDKLSTSKDLNAFANQTPQTSATAAT